MLPTLVELNNGTVMPSLGAGTWRVPPHLAREATLAAIDIGYRLIDTSLAYGNERQVGEAVRICGVPREQLHVTTKLESQHYPRNRVVQGFQRSFANLDIGYIDLYLVHWPAAANRTETWKGMEDLLGDGRCRAIGVSNYEVAHLEEVLEKSQVVPAVNQVEIYPSALPQELISFCREHRIQVQSYSPLDQGKRLRDRVVRGIAEKHGRTPAQVILRWHLQHGLVPLPRSVKRAHLEGNYAVYDFSLNEDDMAALDEPGRPFNLPWNPADVE